MSSEDELNKINKGNNNLSQDSKNTEEELSESGQPAGVEADGSETFMEPFDPDLISIEPRVVPMDTLVRRLKQGSIKLRPNFQRNEVWDIEQRSRLIESIILKIPLPMFYVAADFEGRWEVVDGLQRLSSIRDFILGNSKKEFLRLEGLEFLGENLNGKSFNDLENDSASQRIVNTIMESEMRFTVINPGTPEEVKRNVFKRLNTGGLALTRHEIRNALYQGKVTELLKNLASSRVFLEATDNSINNSRMASQELILYYLSFAIFPREDYKGNIDAWLSNAMRVINLMPELPQSELKKIFATTENIPELKVSRIEDLEEYFFLAMARSVDIFGDHAFRKSLPSLEKNKKNRRTPINKALFETWSNILFSLSQDEFDFLKEKKDLLILLNSILLSGDEDLEKIFNFMISKRDIDSLEFSSDHYDYVKTLSLCFFGEDISDIPLENLVKAQSIEVIFENNGAYRSTDREILVATKLQRLFNGIEGDRLSIAISRNASERESALTRYEVLSSLVNNIITHIENKRNR